MTTPARPASPPGLAKNARVGSFLLGDTLGQGSFGKVKAGVNVVTGEKVAIKIVDKSSISDVNDVERVCRETFILTSLKHENIIRLYEVIDTPSALLLAMEFAGGGELYNFVGQKGRLDEIRTCELFHEIISGVEYCHRQKIIHRDLKLENILLDKDGHVKIADFGLSNSIKFGQKMNTNCGTPAYTCPEQIGGMKYVGSSADIWSLGVILFAMVSGFLPFEAASLPALFSRIRHRLFQKPEFLTSECADLIDKMLTIDPEQRATLSDIRNHPWFLMEYNPDLVEKINALPPVTQEMIQSARNECQTFSDEKRGPKGKLGSVLEVKARPRHLLLAEMEGRAHTRSPKSADFATFQPVAPDHRRCSSTSPRVPLKGSQGTGSPRGSVVRNPKRHQTRGSTCAISPLPAAGVGMVQPTAVRPDKTTHLPSIPGAQRAHNRTVSSPVLSVEAPTPAAASVAGTSRRPQGELRGFMAPRKVAK